MQKGFWIILGLVVAGMFGLFLLSSEPKSSVETYDTTKVQLTDHIFGLEEEDVASQAALDSALEGKVILTEYGDFQCSACAQFFPVLKQLELDFAGDLVVVFRHFPLTNIHPQTMSAHRAAIAAGDQGAFWDMHDLLFARQSEWSGSSSAAKTFEGYAEQLELDLEQYRIYANSQAAFDRITVDQRSATAINVNSTPTIYINDERVEIPTYEALTELIEQALDN